MDRRRILLVNYEYPPLGGGAATATQALAKEFADLGAEVRILTSAFKGLPRKETDGPFQILRVPAIRRRAERSNPFEMMSFMISASWHGLRMTAQWKPDISIAFFGIPGGPVSLALKRFRKAPYIVSLRGGDVPGHQADQLALHHKLTGPFIRHIWRQAAGVVANSAGLRDQARKTCPQIDIPVIPNGVDIDFFSPLPGQKLRNRTSHRAETGIRILFVGRVSYEKGLQHLLPAIAGLSELDVKLTIVGDGPFMTEIRAQVEKLELANRVECPGWIAREKLPDVYCDADLFVFPSSDEGMPNTVLEAMACGLPVITTRIPGCEELVVQGETGLLVPAGDADALQRALSELGNDPEARTRMGAASRERAMTNYSWRKSAEAYLALANAILIK